MAIAMGTKLQQEKIEDISKRCLTSVVFVLVVNNPGCKVEEINV